MTVGKQFSHLDSTGQVKMVDVTSKTPTTRVATAEGKIYLQIETLQAIKDNSLPKGNVFTTAKLAGIQAAKKTAGLIPLCHPLPLSWIDLAFETKQDHILIRSIVKTQAGTGVEMEALTAVSVAALTIYDMCKAVDPSMKITGIRLVEKTGGRTSFQTQYRPRVGVITLSDRIAAGEGNDKSGTLLQEGFKAAGCPVDHYLLLPDGSKKLKSTLQDWIESGVELILTTGGTGLGPRDLTIPEVEKLLETRLPGVEQALHAYGRKKIKTAMLSRLLAGTIGETIIICLPGSPGAVKDALEVLIPTIFHAGEILKGAHH
jgi:molybdenum cofactor biosynthesis protein MoaC